MAAAALVVVAVVVAVVEAGSIGLAILDIAYAASAKLCKMNLCIQARGYHEWGYFDR